MVAEKSTGQAGKGQKKGAAEKGRVEEIIADPAQDVFADIDSHDRRQDGQKRGDARRNDKGQKHAGDHRAAVLDRYLSAQHLLAESLDGHTTDH